MAANEPNARNAPSPAAIGEKLKSAREKKSLDITQVQKQTKIHSTVLIALEEGRCDDILTPTYARSFLKEYARFLGLDHNEILKEYSVIHPEERRPAQSFNVNKVEKENWPGFSGIIYFLKFAVILIVLIAAGMFLWHKGIPRPKAGRQYTKPAKAAKNRTAPARNKVIAQKDFSRKKEIPSKKSASNTAVGQKNKPFNMVLKVNEPVWVEVSKDGLLLFKRFLPKGTVESFRAEDSINILVAKAEAVEIVLNGRSLGSPGKGMIKNLEITRSGIKVR